MKIAYNKNTDTIHLILQNKSVITTYTCEPQEINEIINLSLGFDKNNKLVSIKIKNAQKTVLRELFSQNVNIKATYDKNANAAYIYLKEKIYPGEVKKTGLFDSYKDEMINLDFDKNDNLIGIEIIDAKTVLPKNFLDSDQTTLI